MPSDTHIVLGTVQFGLDYGISNDGGKPSFETVCDIIKTAYENGVDSFDTAQCYGDSEMVLGRALTALGIADKVRINTKLDPALAIRDGLGIATAVEDSINRLQVPYLWCLMTHSFEAGKEIESHHVDIRALKNKGVIKQYGISVYSADEALAALDMPEVDMIQVPANAWDFAMVDEKVFATAKTKGIAVMVRSLYLQGLLLLDPEEVGMRLPVARELSAQWNTWAQSQDLELIEAALGVVSKYASMVTVGADSSEQIACTIECLNQFSMDDAALSEWRLLLSQYDTKDICDPRSWTCGL